MSLALMAFTALSDFAQALSKNAVFTFRKP